MILEKKQYESMENFIHSVEPFMKRCVRDFFSKLGDKTRSDAHILDELYQVGYLSLAENWYTLMRNETMKSSNLYLNIYHDLYTHIATMGKIHIPRYKFSSRNSNYSFVSADSPEFYEQDQACFGDFVNEDDRENEEFMIDMDLFRRHLTKKERIVLNCLLRGMGKSVIAKNYLFCSPTVVGKHVRRIAEKYNDFFQEDFAVSAM